MSMLCRYADKFGVLMCLEVEPFDSGGPDERELIAFYWRFGFRGEAGEMVREPAER